MASRITSLLAVLLLTGAVAASSVRADGDPASDTLLGENVFYPYQPPVLAGVQHTLNAETAAAKAGGFPIKVALIAAPIDLGVIPDLFGKPQQYADFLDQEISFQGRQPLLVVMATGYGTEGLPAAATAAARRLTAPSGTTATALAQAAIVAVDKLAAADGHPVKGVAGVGGSGSSGGGSSSVPIVIGLAVAAVLVAGALIALRRRQPKAV